MSSLASPALTPLRGLPPLILACLAAVWLIWSSTYLAIKWALVSFPPFWQMGTRFIAAGVLLAAWMRWRGARWPDRREWINATVLGALMLGLGYGLTAVAELSVSSGLVVAFIAVGPALQAAMEWPYGLRPTRMEAAGIGLGLIGVLGLAAGQGFSASPEGLLAVLGASVAWKLGSVWSHHGLPRALGGRPLDLTPGAMGYASQMLAGGVVLLLMSMAAGEQPSWPIEARAFWSWLYLVVAGSLVAFSAYMFLMANVRPALAASYSYVNPAVALGVGAWLGGESVAPQTLLALPVILAAVAILMSGRR